MAGTLCLLLLAIVTCWEATGLAAEWSLVPSMSSKAYYNDNLLLTPLPHDPTYGYWISPGVEFAGKTERLEVSGKAALDFVDYYGGEPTRFTNVFLPVAVKYRTEQNEWGFTGGFTRDNTLMGELLTTGIVLRFTQRNLWNLNPSWTRMITEKFGFQSTLQFSDASYQDALRLGLVDYQVYGGSAGFLYHVTERDDVQLAGTYTNFHTTNAPFGLRAYYPGAMLSVTHSFTEGLKATVYGGPRFVSSTTQVGGFSQTTADTIWIYGASLTQQFEQASLQLSAIRDIFPSGFGVLLQTDRIGALTTYNLTDTLTASLDASWYLVSGVTSQARGGTLQEQRLFYITPKLTWHFSEWWRAEASYAYRWRDSETLNEPVMSNTFMIMLTYYPPKLSISN
ncbi:MAG: hypothetical protein JNL86_05530 [Nitrospira sp.]|nr:hypothetical protein [Nitrospira sp.]